jgi:hypothetical protein
MECLHPELEWVPLRARTEGAFRGHEGYERFRADTWEHYDVATAGVFEFRDDKIVRWQDFGSEERALAEARAREADQGG